MTGLVILFLMFVGFCIVDAANGDMKGCVILFTGIILLVFISIVMLIFGSCSH